MEVLETLNLDELPCRCTTGSRGRKRRRHQRCRCHTFCYHSRADSFLCNRVVKTGPDTVGHPVRIHGAALCPCPPTLCLVVTHPCRHPAPTGCALRIVGHLHNHITLENIARACRTNRCGISVQRTGCQSCARRVRGTFPNRYVTDRGRGVPRLRGAEFNGAPGTFFCGGRQRCIRIHHSCAWVRIGTIPIGAHKQAERLVAHRVTGILPIARGNLVYGSRRTLRIQLLLHEYQKVNRVFGRRLPLQLLWPGAATQWQRCRIRREDETIRIVRCRGSCRIQNGCYRVTEQIAALLHGTKVLNAHLYVICQWHALLLLLSIAESQLHFLEDSVTSLYLCGGACHSTGDHERLRDH